ncbi:MAG: RNA-binding domain-containing protein [Planctomyces sp.]|jgi:ATP-dependent DNA helicase RecG
METTELLEAVGRGEDSRHQFKEDVTNATSLAAEIAAFANSGGGQIFIGVADNGSIHGLDVAAVGRLNQLISNTASTNVRPAINPRTENVSVGNGIVLVVTIPDGLSKPYVDNSGVIWVKSGSDKRRVTAREELQRMFQTAQLVHGDDIPVPGTSVSDIDVEYFRQFFTKRFGMDLEEQGLSLAQVLTNMRLLSTGLLTVSGALLFATDPTPLVPAFHIKAVCYPGTDIHASQYADSADIYGRIDSQFEQAMSFVLRNLRREQRDQGVNSEGILEVPRIVFEELLANAIIHRDFFVSAPIRIFMFDDRIEIISPGHLPNNLTVANIRSGNSNMRNPILASYATKVLPYRGLGNGIVRAIKEYPKIDLIDDRDGNRFVVIVRRPSGGGRV